MTTSPKVSIIIVNWNGHGDTIECLESLRDLKYPNYDIIVVDNGSTDESVKAIKERFSEVSILETGENLGFPGGNNVGLRHAFENGADYAWLLNNDAVVDPYSLDYMVNALRTADDVAMVGSKIYYFDRRDVLWFAGAYTKWAIGKNIMIGWGEKDQGQFDLVRNVDTLTGCSMVVKRDICEKIGFMDESYFLYVEEVDWCLRARNHGYRCVFVPESVVYHKISSSTKGQWPEIFSYYNTRNMLKTVKSNFSFPRRELYIFTIVAERIWSAKRDLVKYVLYRLFEAKGYSYNLGSIEGVLDFFLKKDGYKNPDDLNSSYGRPQPV